MVAIRDETDPAFGVSQGCPHHTRLAAAKGGHGVEQVREAGEPCRQRFLHLFEVRRAVPPGDDDSRRGQLPNRLDTHPLRGHGHQPHARMGRAKPFNIRLFDKPDVRGLITGLTLDSNRDHVLTAFLQSVVFQTQELLEAMHNDGAEVERLRVDGGMTVNDALCQFLADILNVPVQRPVNTETTALGAAMLAGLGQGVYADLAAAGQAWHTEHDFQPGMEEARRMQLLTGPQFLTVIVVPPRCPLVLLPGA